MTGQLKAVFTLLAQHTGMLRIPISLLENNRTEVQRPRLKEQGNIEVRRNCHTGHATVNTQSYEVTCFLTAFKCGTLLQAHSKSISSSNHLSESKTTSSENSRVRIIHINCFPNGEASQQKKALSTLFLNSYPVFNTGLT